MKFTVLAILMIGQMSLAGIRNSTLELRHQKKIETALYERCGLSGLVTEVGVEEETINVDNGIQDARYTVELIVKAKVDQVFYDTYRVTVVSFYSDGYDHSERAWGSYSVESLSSPDVSCK